MFLEALSVLIRVPEPLHSLGYLRVDPEVVSEHAIRVVRNSREEVAGTLDLALQIFKRHAFEAVLHEHSNRFHGMLHALEIGLQAHGTCRSCQMEHLVGVVSSQIPNRSNADSRGNAQGNNDDSCGQQRDFRANGMHLLLLIHNPSP